MLITHWFWANHRRAINRIRCPIVFYFVCGVDATHFTLSKGMEIFIPARFTLKNAGAGTVVEPQQTTFFLLT